MLLANDGSPVPRCDRDRCRDTSYRLAVVASNGDAYLRTFSGSAGEKKLGRRTGEKKMGRRR
jgi:hypothetical protein